MRDNPRPQEIYRHFKGGLYQIITLAKHSKTGSIFVIYQALYGEFNVYARELSEFLSKTDREKYPSASQEYRFEKVTVKEKPADKVQVVELRSEPPQKQKAESNQAELQKQEKERALEDLQKSEMEPNLGKSQRPEMERSLEEPQRTEMEQETISIDPLVMEFLDAGSYEERLNILAALHGRITDEMINTMSVAVDVEINEGEIEERYEALKTCLVTLEKYECNRLR